MGYFLAIVWMAWFLIGVFMMFNCLDAVRAGELGWQNRTGKPAHPLTSVIRGVLNALLAVSVVVFAPVIAIIIAIKKYRESLRQYNISRYGETQ